MTRSSRAAPRRRSAALAALLAGALAVAAVPAAAQEVERVAAVVNEDMISLFDVRQRIRMMIFSSGLEDTPEQARRLAPDALRGLIEERLRAQEAERLEIRVAQSEIDGALDELARQNGVTPADFLELLGTAGISDRAMIGRIRADLAWERVVRRHLVPTIEVGEEEIDAVLARIDAAGSGERLRVAEIVLAISGPDGEAQARSLAGRLLAELRAGAPFAAVASQFSQSATAAVGGDLGWIRPGQFSAAIDRMLAGLEPGEIGEPVVTADSLTLYGLIARETVEPPAAGDAEVTLRLVELPLDGTATESEIASLLDLAGQVGGAVETCDDLAGVATELGAPPPAEPVRMRISDLNDSLRPVVAGLAAGGPGRPVRTAGSVQVVMVCERDDDATQERRDEIANQIGRERLELLARRYLRDLQRAAFIDVRV